MNTPYYTIDHEIDFINGLANRLKARALRGYLVALDKRALDFSPRPMNEGIRGQLKSRARDLLQGMPAPRGLR